MAAAMALAVDEVEKPLLRRPTVLKQVLAESFANRVKQEPMVRGVLWKDNHGRARFDFRIYLVYDHLRLMELRYTSEKDPELGETLCVRLDKGRSVADAWDRIIHDWRTMEYRRCWEHDFALVLAGKTDHEFQNVDIPAQREILDILLNGLLAALDRQIFCHPDLKDILEQFYELVADCFED